MDALVEAAQEEGKLNVIALPPDWANYGEMLETFSEKYDIEINSASPDGSSQDELNAVDQPAGPGPRARRPRPRAPFARQAKAQELTAPYQVETWDEIPEDQKDPDGHWYNDYGGYLSIGCNATIVAECPTTMAEPARPAVRRPGRAQRQPDAGAAAFSGVWAASLANGGDLDDIGPGIDFFVEIKDGGNFNPVESRRRRS